MIRDGLDAVQGTDRGLFCGRWATAEPPPGEQFVACWRVSQQVSRPPL